VGFIITGPQVSDSVASATLLPYDSRRRCFPDFCLQTCVMRVLCCESEAHSVSLTRFASHSRLLSRGACGRDTGNTKPVMVVCSQCVALLARVCAQIESPLTCSSVYPYAADRRPRPGVGCRARRRGLCGRQSQQPCRRAATACCAFGRAPARPGCVERARGHRSACGHRCDAPRRAGGFRALAAAPPFGVGGRRAWE
jgi:hypothetical protein